MSKEMRLRFVPAEVEPMVKLLKYALEQITDEDFEGESPLSKKETEIVTFVVQRLDENEKGNRRQASGYRKKLLTP